MTKRILSTSVIGKNLLACPTEIIKLIISFVSGGVSGEMSGYRVMGSLRRTSRSICTHMATLYDAICDIKSIIGGHLTSNSLILFKEVKILDLSLNTGSILFHGGLSYLKKLTSLDISGSTKSISDSTLSLLVSLKSLNLSKNAVIQDSGIGPLTNLTHLDISYNDEISSHQFYKLPKLKSLRLSDDRWVLLSRLPEMSNLTSLSVVWRYIGGNVITNKLLTSLVNLSSLYINCSNHIDDRCLERMTCMKNLVIATSTPTEGAFMEKMPHLVDLSVKKMDGTMLTLPLIK
jgi:hypothetical protein